MSRCPITYRELPPGHQGTCSAEGLRLLSRSLTRLEPLPLDMAQLAAEAAARAGKMSVPGVQPKLSARLDARAGRFEIVDQGGQWILKLPTAAYPHLPENEDLTMRLAADVGIEAPVHGLIAGRDGAWTYFVRRFDRVVRRRKLAVEDFAQLSGRRRDTKYDASMERVAEVIDRYTTYPAVERRELFRRVLFCFLTGGEDMHLKNWSLVTRPPRVQLAPGYDLLNSTIALRNPQEEMALPLNGKKRNLTRRDLVDYFGSQRLELPAAVVQDELDRLRTASARWPQRIRESFLTPELAEAYLALVAERQGRLWG